MLQQRRRIRFGDESLAIHLRSEFRTRRSSTDQGYRAEKSACWPPAPFTCAREAFDLNRQLMHEAPRVADVAGHLWRYEREV